MFLAASALLSCATLRGSESGREGLVETTLKNGLRVVVIEDHSAPVVALNVWVRTGAADETDAESGMAHVFEHMLFKGTERRAVGEIASTVEAAGGNINAYTTFDMTVYHITMASRDADVGIDVLADAVLHSTFDPEELAKEEEVVLEEIRRGQDSPSRVLFHAIFANAYTQHPYRRPVIGTEESVRSFTREQLLDFHRRWYVPNNMVFVAVGDLDPDVAIEQIREAFRDGKSRSGLSHLREPEPVEPRAGAEVLRRDFNKPMMGIAFPITSFSDPDTAYLDILSQILGGGESSRLYRSVKDRQGLVHSVSAHAYTPLDPGLFFIDASLEGERIEESLAAIAGEVHRMQSFGPSEVEIERARLNILSGEIYEKETMQGQARKVGYYSALGGGLDKEKEYLERVRRATVEDVQRAATQYLDANRMTIVVLLPKKDRPGLDSNALLEAYRRGEERSEEIVGRTLEEGIRLYTLPNGLRVVVKRNTSVPLVALRIVFLGGRLAEDEKTQGISSFLAEMLERGTEQRSSAQIAAEVEGIAGSLGGFSGRNSFGVTAGFLTESLDTGLELFADVVLHPSYPEEEVEKVRTEILAAIDRREDNLQAKSFEIFGKALYGKHPYRFPSLGTRATVSRFDRKMLQDYYRRYAGPRAGVIGIVGDVDPDEMVEAIGSHFSRWESPENKPLPGRSLPFPPTELTEVKLEKNKQQTHIVFGFLGISLRDPDVAAVEVLTQILSGQGGRLFMELRDRQSLAYSVGAFSIEGLDPGSMGVYIGCAPDKREAALEGIRKELERILEDPIAEQELERAKSYLIGSNAISLQRFHTQATLLALDEVYGLGATHHLGYGKRIEAVTVDDVKRVAGRIIHLDAPIIAVVK
jgi:zinc protease